MPATLDRAPFEEPTWRHHNFEEPLGQPRRTRRRDPKLWCIEARWTIPHLRPGWWVRRRYHTEAQRDEGLRSILHSHKGYDYIEFRAVKYVTWKGEDV